MITRNDYELNCLIEGKENILTFFIPCNAEIKELEQVIYDEGGLDDGFQDLALWKVEIDLGPLRVHLSEFNFEYHQGVRLNAVNEHLSDLWGEQPSGRHLHIFARVHDKEWSPEPLPPSSQEILDVVGHKRRRLDDSKAAETLREEKEFEDWRCRFLYMEEDARRSDLPWLKELHSKIWNRGILKPKLFRKVETTRARYDALQACLKREYPDRDFAQYDGSGHDA